MINNKIKSTFVFMVLVTIIFFNSPKIQAQSTGQLYLTGPTTVHYGDVVPYSIKDAMYNDAPSSSQYHNFNWMIVNNGSVLTYVNESYQPDVEVYWDGAPSQEKVYVLYQRQGEPYEYYAELNVTVLPTPSTPDPPTVLSSGCNQVILQRGNPPGNLRTGGQDITWYWQTSPTGTSTANTDATVTVTSGTEYFLRARRYNGIWSDESSSVQYFIGVSAPTVYNVTQPTVTTPTGSVTLAGLPETGTWVINPGNISGTGGLTTITGLNPSSAYNFTVTNSSGCTSNGSANVVINAQTSTLDAPTISSVVQPTCTTSKGEFTIGNYNAAYTYTVTPSIGVDLLGIKVAAPPGNYTIRATSGAVTSPPSGNISINAQPITPAAPIVGTINQPTLSTATGSVTLTGLPYYWIVNPGNFSGSGPTATITGLRAGRVHHFTVTNSEGCTSNASADVVIDLQPFSCNGITDENYVHTIVPLIESTDIDALANNQKQESITYYDGLGRPKQKVAIRGGGINNVDLITHIDYDSYGRQTKEYLPYTDGNNCGAFRTADIDMATKAYYANHFASDINTNTPNPYSEKEIEPSPLSRVLKQAAPGNDWMLGKGHEIKMDYKTNSPDDAVKRFTVDFVLTDNTYIPTLKNKGYFSENVLYKNIVFDENTAANPLETRGSTVEFKNKEGQVILKRTYGIVATEATNRQHDTYYVYDDFGKLSFVIPPKAADLLDSANIEANTESWAVVEPGSTPLHLKASNSIVLKEGFHAKAGSVFSAIIDNGNQSVLDNLCYQYRYDQRSRLIEKKLPGKGWEYIVYNKQDKPVLSQDANLRVDNKWMFTKYDVLDRVTYSGEYKNTVETTRAQMQFLADQNNVLFEQKQTANTINGTTVYYSNNAFPNINDANINLFTISYYDDYNFDAVPADISSIGAITNVKGLSTGSKTRILTTNNWITNCNYYDTKNRPFYNYSKNDFLGTVSTVKNQFDFAGKVLQTTSTHTKNSITTTLTDVFAYDQAGRLTKQTQAINGDADPEVIVSNTYNELGQLVNKGVGGKASQNRLQNVDYKYNIRGWLKNINDINTIGNDLFAFQISYNAINNSIATPLYNGNISETFWKTANIDTSLKGYTYGYDELNRLTYAIGELDDKQEIVSYDKNGNIMSLYRTGIRPKNTGTSKKVMQILDDLTYTYDQGNKLIKVEDNADPSQGFKNGANLPIEYTYDHNGNMKTDANKGIHTNITYNFLNLPTQVTLPGGTISYIYDANGIKQRKIAGSITTDYAGGFQYENDILQFFPQPEGYVSKNNGVFEYIYQYKDHLGNVRLSYNKNLSIVEENNYYPFGLKQTDNNNVVNSLGNATAQKYKYNGKELQDELGLNIYDYGARNYDPALGRFMNLDPMAEKRNWLSPYNYVQNNPILKIDPDGMLDGDYYTNDGDWLGNDGIDDQKVHVVNDGDYKPIGGGKTNIYKSTELTGVTNEILLAFASVIHAESGGSKDESYAIGNVTMNFVDGGGSRQVPTLEDAVMYDNKFAQGATQDNLTSFMSLGDKNCKFAMGAAINAIGNSQGISGFSDYSGGANGWDGIDLISSKASNSHRGYTWSEGSKDLLSTYKKDNNGGVDVSGFTYKKSGYQISATKIIGNTIYTNITTGRGEKKQSDTRFHL